MRKTMLESALTLMILAVMPQIGICVALHCPDCSHEQARLLVAETGVSPTYVYDFNPDRLWNYVLEDDPALNSEPVVHEAPVDPFVEEFWSKLTELYRVAGAVELEATVSAEEVGLGEANAYDLIQASQIENRLALALGQNLSLLDRQLPSGSVAALVSLRDFGLDLGMESHDPGLLVNVQFRDGSSSRFFFSVADSRPVPRYVRHSARDSNGNPIIETNDARYAGHFSFGQNSDDISKWERSLRRFSIPIIGERSHAAECAWAGESLTCRYSH